MSCVAPVTSRARGTPSPTGPAGQCRPPYDALNLGDHVGDDPDARRGQPRRLARGRIGARRRPACVFMSQVHGAEVAVVDAPPGPAEPPRPTRW